MKNVIILTCWALFAQILPLAAQQNNHKIPEVLQDTLVIKLQDRNQIHVTGTTLTELAKYERADSLKQLFLQDLETGFTHGSFAELPQRLHYLVSADGKRRLKAEFTDPAEDKFNLEHEKNRLRLDLPRNHFTVYDLKTNVQTHYYLQDSAALQELANTRIKPALDEAAQEDKKLKKFVKYTVEKQGDLYMGKGTAGNKTDMLSLEPLLGLGLIGNQPSPVFGATIKITLHDKYAVPRYQLGYNYFGVILPALPESSFKDVNPGSMFDIFFAINTTRVVGKINWLGISGGMTNETRNKILPDHAFKAGFLFSHKSLTYSLDFIRTDGSIFYKKGNSISLFSIRTSF